MRTIFKYPLRHGKINALDLPINAIPRTVGMQGSEVFLWVELDEAEERMQTNEFIVVGTGWNIPSPYTAYIGTIHDLGFVWHIYHKGANV